MKLLHHLRLPALLAGTLTMAATGLLVSAADGAGAAEPTTPVAKINFQSEGAPVPSGWTKDFGQGFDNGRGYGWVATNSSAPKSMTGYGRDRNVLDDQVADTLVHMQLGGTAARWEYAVANGRYEVRVAVGDHGPYLDSEHRVVVEGKVAINRYVPVKYAPRRAVTVQVDVRDGRLTLDPEDGRNTKIQSVEIVQVGASTVPPAEVVAPSGASIKVNFQDEDAAVPSGYQRDFGQAYDATRNSGWLSIATSQPVSIVGNGRERRMAGDQRIDTLVHAQLDTAGGVQTAAKWELAVANGTYDVTVALGDASTSYDSEHKVKVEDLQLISSFKPGPARRTREETGRVTVTDGRLTLNPVGGRNTKFLYTIITPVSVTGPAPTTAPPATTAPTTAAPTPTTATPPTTAPPATTVPPTTAPPTTAPPTTAPPTTVGRPSSGDFPSWGAASAWDGLGIYKEGGSDGMAAWQRWVGRDVNYRVVWASSDTWTKLVSGFRSITDPTSGYRRNNDQTIIVTFGLVSKESSKGSTTAAKLTNAANGGNDAHWDEIGRIIKERGLEGTYPDGRPKVVLRVGWEHNGTWYPWASKGNEATWVKAWRRAHDVVSRHAPDMQWVWGVTAGGGTVESVEAAWPGDAYVDIIEMDVYDHWGAYANKGGGDADPSLRQKTWESIESGTKGVTLDWLVDMAERHKKLIAITEFGLVRLTDGTYGQIGGGDNPEFIQHMYDWMNVQAKAGRLAWANYFEVDNDTGPHALWNESAGPNSTAGSTYPKGARKFLDLFGGH